jgi:hypothetical protein
MAVTPAAIMAVNDAQGTGRILRIDRHIPQGGGATVDLWYVTDLSSYDKKPKWCQTTNTGDAATQAAAIVAAMAPAL